MHTCACKQQRPHGSNISESVTPDIPGGTKMCERNKFGSAETKKTRQRGRRCSHSADEGDYQRRSWLFYWSQAAEDSGEYRRAVTACVWQGGEESGLFELRVNASKMAELAYLHPGSAVEGLQAAFYVTRLTASSGGGFEGSPSLAGLGLRLTQL